MNEMSPTPPTNEVPDPNPEGHLRVPQNTPEVADDPEKAQDMAVASDELRTQAANLRLIRDQVANLTPAGPDEYPATDEDIKKTQRSYFGNTHRAKRQRAHMLQQLRNGRKFDDEVGLRSGAPVLDKEHALETAGFDDNQPGLSDPVENAYNYLRKYVVNGPEQERKFNSHARDMTDEELLNQIARIKDAEAADELAGSVEEWAGIIHDRPLSDELQADIEALGIQQENLPMALAKLEIENEKKMVDIADSERALEELQSNIVVNINSHDDGYYPRPSLREIRTQQYEGSINTSLHELITREGIPEQFQEEYIALETSDDTTNRDRKEFFKRLYAAVYITPKKVEALAAQKLLRSIRGDSGSVESNAE